MNQEKFSTIGHTGMPFWNPVSPGTLDSWLADLPLTQTSQVLDVGCGQGELLVRLVKKFGCFGVGVDRSESAINKAQQEANQRISDGNLNFKVESFDIDSWDPESFDLAVCIGSSHALGDMQKALPGLAELVKPGGLLLFGEGFWQQTPAPEYLAFLGCDEKAYKSHQGNMDLMTGLGFEVVKGHETSPEGWSAYEDTYADNLLSFVAANPDDPDCPAFEKKIRAWREAYLKWGKDTLGFGLYLLRKGQPS